jgi:hypothetical protein
VSVKTFIVAGAVAWGLAACALRPRYNDLVQAGGQSSEREKVVLVFVDPSTSKPIQGLKIQVGERKDRVTLTTDANGRVALPVSEALRRDNPLVTVERPDGALGYSFGPEPVQTIYPPEGAKGPAEPMGGTNPQVAPSQPDAGSP